MTKKFYPNQEEEMLQKLKDEIYRLGLEDYPSRLRVAKLYNRDNMPHPQTYMAQLGPWRDIMKSIGLDNSRPKKESRVKSPLDYWGYETEGVRLEQLIVELCRVGLNGNPSRDKLTKVYDSKNMLHPNTYRKNFGTWENVLKIIEKDDRISRKIPAYKQPKKYKVPDYKEYKRRFPLGKNPNILINAMIDEMKTKQLYTRADYDNNYNKDFLPSLYVFTRDTGLTWTELKALYEERLGVSIPKQ